MFKQGDLVLHPKLGVGEILSIEKRTILGEKKQVYRISINGKTKTRVSIPADRAGEIGLRYVIYGSKIDAIWDILASPAENLPEDNRKRVVFVEKKLRTANPQALAELLRDITWHKHQGKKLNQPGRAAYDRALELLISELAVAQEMEEDTVKTKITEILKSAMA